MRKILLTIITPLVFLVSCADRPEGKVETPTAPGITKEQVYEMAQIGDMMTAMDQEIDPYEIIVTKENMQAITDQIIEIVERYGYGETECRLEGYKQGYLFYFDLLIKLKHSPCDYKATAMYVWEDPAI